MDSKSTSNTGPDNWAAIFQNATIDKAKGNEFSSRDPAGDVFSYAAVSLSNSISLPLPHELVERMLLLLDAESLLTCRLVNRKFNEIIQSSTLLQYFLACKAAGVVDNPQSPFSYAERFEALKRREDAWRELKPVFEMTIDGIPYQTFNSISRIIEGTYFCSDDDCKYLKYCRLPSSSQDKLQWTESLNCGPVEGSTRVWLTLETAIYEHDLLVLSGYDIVNQANTPQWHILDLLFLKFSTGAHHPLARHPRIHVQRSLESEPFVVSGICGDHLALAVSSHDGTFSDKLFVFDWKTGEKRLQHEAIEDAYTGLVFASPELLLVPNRALLHFEVWHIPPSHCKALPPVQILALNIPAISLPLFYFNCRGEPNPYLRPTSASHVPPRPFFSSPEESIIVTKLKISNASYNLIMHRRALVNTIQKWKSPSLLEKQKYLPQWLMNEVSVHEISDLEDGSVRFEAQSKLVSKTRIIHDSIFANSGSSSISSEPSTISSTSRCDFLQIPWAEWGPLISLWLEVNEIQAQRIGHSAGQRYMFSGPSPHDRQKLTISVMDFNPYNVRKHKKIMAHLRCGESKDNNDSDIGKEEKLKVFDHGGTFLEEVRMGLQHVVYQLPDEYEFDAMWMDEERLLGAKFNHEGWEESIKVLYIG